MLMCLKLVLRQSYGIDPFCVAIRKYTDWIIDKEQRFITMMEVKSTIRAAFEESCVVAQ